MWLLTLLSLNIDKIKHLLKMFIFNMFIIEESFLQISLIKIFNYY